MTHPGSNPRLLTFLTLAALAANGWLLAGPSLLGLLEPPAALASPDAGPVGTHAVEEPSDVSATGSSLESEAARAEGGALAVDPLPDATPEPEAGSPRAPSAPPGAAGGVVPRAGGSSSSSPVQAADSRGTAAAPPSARAAASELPAPLAKTADGSAGADVAIPADPPAEAEAERLFRKVVRAYEAMDPANASSALIQLADRDMYSTVRTLLAMDPRKSGAILDAMSVRMPQTAATITAEMLAEASPAAQTPAR